MENLTNEQIVDIINFYKMCGISEDMYLSRAGVLDLFSLIGISPEFDEQGNRLPTVYEQLSIAPMFREGKEVPIVFAIKHKVSKIHKFKNDDKFASEKFTYSGSKEQVNDKIILNKLKQDYFSAVANGNLVEATRIYDLIDMITGGKADYFIGVQYNCVKFYKKMQKQLLIDMFANFVILMILSKEKSIKDGVVKFDKLYKSFLKHQLEHGNFGLFKNQSIRIPEISKMTISVSEDVKIKTSNVKDLQTKEEKPAKTEKPQDFNSNQSFISYIKSKVEVKLNKLKNNLTKGIFPCYEEKLIKPDVEKSKNSVLKTTEPTIKSSVLKTTESTINILESD